MESKPEDWIVPLDEEVQKNIVAISLATYLDGRDMLRHLTAKSLEAKYPGLEALVGEYTAKVDAANNPETSVNSEGIILIAKALGIDSIPESEVDEDLLTLFNGTTAEIDPGEDPEELVIVVQDVVHRIATAEDFEGKSAVLTFLLYSITDIADELTDLMSVALEDEQEEGETETTEEATATS